VSDIYLRSVVSPGRGDELLLHSLENKMVCDWSPDGRYLVYASTNSQTKSDLWLLPLGGERKPIAFLRTPFFELQGRVSPDGHWMAYTSDESGAWEVYVQSFPEPGDKQIVSIGGGMEPRWRRDGRELYYLAPDRTMMAVAVQPGAPLQFQRPKPLFHSSAASMNVFRSLYAVSAAGDRFLVDSAESNGKEEPITLLMNWLNLIKH
jgi:dipeptidyl aminopeptidase/acylaminoacyl peptidase